jgi:hypothetical protein
MNTTDIIPTRKSFREIVQEVNDRALIEIVTAGKNTISQAFATLKAEADELRGFDKTYVPPWEIKQPPVEQVAPLRIRTYAFRNAMDGIIHAVHEMTKLYPQWPKFDSGEIHKFLKSTHDVNYSQPWMAKALENLFYNKEYRDLSGRRVIVTRTCGVTGHYRVAIP